MRLKAMSAISRTFLFSLCGGGRDGYGGSRHSGCGEVIAKRVPLCDGMRSLGRALEEHAANSKKET